MVNLFPEVVPEGGLEPAFLMRTPGLRLLVEVGEGPIRGLWNVREFLYVVSGTGFYKVDTAYNVTYIGMVSTCQVASMVDNGTQIFIACNGPSYIYNTSTEVFAQITDVDFPGAVTVGYLDGYFVFNEPNSQKYWITSLLDGTQVEPLDFASAEASPDLLLSLIVDHKQVWLFGANSIEVIYNAGSSPFPLQPISGASNEIGCIAAYSVAKMDNGIFWLGADNRGFGVIYRSTGYTAQRISTHAVEWQIQQYTDLTNASAYTYQQDGHSFYVLNFPSQGKTWVYDASTSAWHERAGFSNGEFIRSRSTCMCMFNALTTVGDFENGNLYSLELETYSDNGQPQKWLRSWRALPTGQNNFKGTTQHSLQLITNPGEGLSDGQGYDPLVMLRFSDDAGKTWSNENWKKTGKIGEYGYRTIWRRLGGTEKIRDRVYEVSGTDPVPVYIEGVELDLTESFS
jgi:hypothetical protein